MIFAAGALAAQIAEFLDRASVDGLAINCAADTPAPPFLLSGKNP